MPAPPSKRRSWFALRVAILLAVLAAVALYAACDVISRRERNEWRRTLDVALVVVPDGAVSAAALETLRQRSRALEAQLTTQFRRYRSGPSRPFAFVWYGPAVLAEPLPNTPSGGVLDAARYAWKLRAFTKSVDARAGVPSRAFDARIYLVVRAPSDLGLVEGMSEHGGRVGVALAELDDSTADLALFVAAHELFHTLGANDRYGLDGRTLLPAGLAEPDREPRFPQRFAEVMARNRPLDESTEVPPQSLDELWVNETTAAEIGWAVRR